MLCASRNSSLANIMCKRILGIQAIVSRTAWNSYYLRHTFLQLTSLAVVYTATETGNHTVSKVINNQVLNY